MIKFLIEKTNLNVEFSTWTFIKEYLKYKNIECTEVKYVPFISQKLETLYSEDDCVVVFGSTSLMKRVNTYHKWIPGVWCNYKDLKMSSYFNYFGKYVIHQDYGFYPIKEVMNKKDYLYSRFGEEKRIFIKPDDNDKRFDGNVIAEENWDSFVSYLGMANPSEDTLCLVSRPVKIDKEWRFVICDKQIVTYSMYADDGKVNVKEDISEEVCEYVNKVLKEVEWTPSALFVMDVCYSNEKYHIMEIGSINCCGFYMCDVAKIIDKVIEVAEREYKDIVAREYKELL